MTPYPVLLVEDNADDVFFFERALKIVSATIQLRVVNDGLAAMAYISGRDTYADRAMFPLPSLIILDLNLPLKNGWEVLQWIRAHAPDPTVPVIVLTSSTSQHDLCEAYHFRANSYLTKPSHPEKLVELVRSLTTYWFAHNYYRPGGASVQD